MARTTEHATEQECRSAPNQLTKYSVVWLEHSRVWTASWATPRAEGGTHDPELLIPLCTAHHTHVHEGRLVIRGRYSEGFAFEHSDGSAYGAPGVSVAAASRLQNALSALTSLGFESGEAQRMLDRARPHVGAEARLEELVRAALAEALLPRLDQPRLDQPRLDQPRLDQPRLDQPRLDQPRLDRVSEAAEWGYGAAAA